MGRSLEDLSKHLLTGDSDELNDDENDDVFESALTTTNENQHLLPCDRDELNDDENDDVFESALTTINENQVIQNACEIEHVPESPETLNFAGCLSTIVFALPCVLVKRATYILKQCLQWWIARDTDEISNWNLLVYSDSSHRKNTALHFAARVGDKKNVEALLTKGTLASLLTKNSKNETPLHIAARSGHVHVVKFLIDWATQNTDVEIGGIQQVLRMRNMEGNTSLHEAVRNGHHSTVLVLVETNDSDLLVSHNNALESPLFMAVDVRASEIVKTILPKSDPSSLFHKSSDGQTILHRAILRADLKTMKIILHNFPNLVNEKDSCRISPLDYAAASGALALVDHLLQLIPSNGSFLDDNLATPAHMAAENGHLNVLKLFVKRGCSWVVSLNNHHQNILHVAAQNGHLKVVRYIQNMLMVKDLLNEIDEDGNTPLHLAAAKLHSSIVSTLIQTGNVDTTTINKKGETVLDIARKFQLVSPSNEGNEGTDGNQAQATPNETGCAGDEKIEAKK